MKRAELLKHATCSACRKPIGHTGLPLFYKVTIERFGVDLQAVKRMDGLGAFLGSHPLANVMGPNEDLAMPINSPTIATLCETCSNDSGIPVAGLSELGEKL